MQGTTYLITGGTSRNDSGLNLKKQDIMKEKEIRLQLLDEAEIRNRTQRVAEAMKTSEIDYLLIGDNVNLYYLTGRVFCGYVLMGADGSLHYWLRRPSTLSGEGISSYRKLEEMLSEVAAFTSGCRIGLTLDDIPFSTITRLAKGIGIAPSEAANASAVMRTARAVKTPLEIEKLRISGIKQAQVYKDVPHLYQPGMTDVELQIEIERALRLAGCLGSFRCSGAEMEIFMGNVLTGDNADTPSPYDFAMGGAGLDPSLPVGADGTLIRDDKPVMVDMNGNFTGYMTDMTRCYVAGHAPEIAEKANRLSADICRAVAANARPGVAASALYNLAAEMAEAAGMSEWFMGHRHHAGFVGHGVGITINELPVLSPRSRDILCKGNVIAVEPKFVIPGVGAVGVENTYIVGPEEGAECITVLSEEIAQLN